MVTMYGVPLEVYQLSNGHEYTAGVDGSFSVDDNDVRALQATGLCVVAGLVDRASPSAITQLTGDVIAGPGNGAPPASIPVNQVNSSHLALMGAGTVKGNVQGASAAPADLNAQQLYTMLSMTGGVRGGMHALTVGEAASGTITIATGFTTLTAGIVQILRSNAIVTGAAKVSVVGGSLVVTNNGSYTATTGDVATWLGVGV